MAGSGAACNAVRRFKLRSTRFAMKSNANAPRFEEDKSGSWWFRLWPRRFAAKKSSPDKAILQFAQRSFMLLAAFDDSTGLRRAASALAVAGFETGDVLCISSEKAWREDRSVSNFARRLRRFLLGIRSEPRMEIPEQIQALLNSGALLILVRPAARFPEACEIIEETGGHIGMANQRSSARDEAEWRVTWGNESQSECAYRTNQGDQPSIWIANRPQKLQERPNTAATHLRADSVYQMRGQPVEM